MQAENAFRSAAEQPSAAKKLKHVNPAPLQPLAPHATTMQPCGEAAAASKVLGRPLTRSVLVLTATGGPEQAGAAEALTTHAGYTNVIALAGGWAEWRKHYTATSRPAPPPGRWIPTGQEALKSGLMSGDAAASYEERLNVEDLTKVGYDK